MDKGLRGRLEADLRVAIKSGDTATRDTLRYVLAAVKNLEIERRTALSVTDESGVINRLSKQLSDAIEQFRAGGRHDLAAHEEAQLAVLRQYLPAQLSEDELRSLVERVINDVDAHGPKDMGKVMPVLIERVAGRAEGRRISDAARAALAERGQTVS
jgi:hypothetical protein